MQAPRIKISKMQISYIDFTKWNLQGSDLSGVTAIEAIFRGAVLSSWIFDDSNLKSANFRDVIASKASFVNSILNGADMRGAWIKEWDFSNAKMAGIDLRDSVLDSSILIDANLIVANLEKASLYYWDMTRANLDRANIKDVKGLDEITFNH